VTTGGSKTAPGVWDISPSRAEVSQIAWTPLAPSLSADGSECEEVARADRYQQNTDGATPSQGLLLTCDPRPVKLLMNGKKVDPNRADNRSKHLCIMRAD